jgi:chromosome partitioning protein
MTTNAFLSYSREDRRQSKVLYDAMTERGLSVWRDQNEIEGGERFWSKIERAIDHAGCVVVILSPNSERSQQVRREVAHAESKAVPIVPVLRARRVDQLDDWWKARVGELNAIETINFTTAIKERIARAVRRHAHRVCQTVPVFNMKGGVGKTTVAAHLAARLNVLKAKRVLVVDLDPQQNLTELLLLPAELKKLQERHMTILGLFEPRKIDTPYTDADAFDCDFSSDQEASLESISRLCHPLQSNGNGPLFDIIASQFQAIKYTELGLDRQMAAIENFAISIQLLKRRYDYVIVDCNPSASLLTRAALQVANRILAPVRPDDSARRGLLFMQKSIDTFYRTRRSLEISVLFNFVQENRPKEERQLIEWLREGNVKQLPGMDRFAGKYLSTEIPESRALRSRYVTLRSVAPQGLFMGLLERVRPGTSGERALKNLAGELCSLVEQDGTYVPENEMSA